MQRVIGRAAHHANREGREICIDVQRVGEIERTGDEEKISLAATVDFYDARLDGLLRLDGVERSTLAVVRIS